MRLPVFPPLACALLLAGAAVAMAQDSVSFEPGTEGEDRILPVEKAADGVGFVDDEIDGRSLLKKDVNVNCKSFEQQKFTLWEEKSNPGMPVRLVTDQNGVTLTMTLSGVKLEKPDSKEFVPPADFLKFGSMPELLGHVQKQMLQQQAK